MRATATVRPRWWLLLGCLAASRAVDNLVGVTVLVLVVRQTGSAGAAAAATAARLAPLALLGTLVVVLALPRPRRLLALSATARAALAGLLALAVQAGEATLPLVVVASALVALVGAPYKAAAGSLVRWSVSEEQLARAGATYQSVEYLSFLVAPALSGLLLLRLTSTQVLWLAAAVAALLSVAAVALPEPPRTRARQRALTRTLTGVHLVASVKDARLLILVRTGARFAYGVLAVLVALLPRRLGLPAEEVGFFQGALGAGALATAGTLRHRVGGLSTVRALAVAVVALGASTALTGAHPGRVLVLLVLAVAGAADLAIHLVCSLALQRALPPTTSAAASGAADSMTAAGLLGGSLLAPLLLRLLGPAGAAAGAGCVLLLLLLLVLPGLLVVSGRADVRRRRAGEVVRLLSGSPALRSASAGTLERLAENGEERTVPRGRLVLREAEPADAVYVLLSGLLAVHVAGEAAVRTGRMPELHPGALFGEVGVLRRVPRTASVLALEDSQVLRLTADDFLAALAGDTEGSDAVAGQAAVALTRSHGSPEP